MTTSRPCSRILATSRCTFVTRGARNAMRAEDDDAARRNLRQLVDEDRAQAFEPVDDELVVHDFVAHVNRRAELLQRQLDDRDRAVDAGAEAAGIGENDVHGALQLAVPRRRPKLSSMSKAAPTVIALSATLNAG